MRVTFWFLEHAAAWLFLVLAASAPGWLLTRRIAFSSPLERLVFTVATGLGAWGMLLFALGSARLLHRPLIIGITTAFAATSLGLLVHARHQLMNTFRAKARDGRFLALAAAAVILWSAVFFHTLFPPTEWDAISNHLVIAQQHLREHSLAVPMGTPQPVLPALNHMLFAWAMALGTDVLAHSIQHTFLLLTAGAMIAWGVRQKQPIVGWTAAALWLAHPLVLRLAGSGYIDIGNAAAAFLCVYALRLFTLERRISYWLLASGMAGMAAATKPLGLAFVAGTIALGALVTVKRRLDIGSFAAGVVLALGVAAPFYAFIARTTGGNPFWPLNPHHATGLWAQVPQIAHPGVGLTPTPLNFLRFPFEMAFNPVTFYPDFYLPVNPIVALWPLTWFVALRDRNVRWWTLWALFYSVLWFASAQFVRYWLPVLPLVGLSIAESLRWVLNRFAADRLTRSVTWASIILTAATFTYSRLAEDFRQRGWPPVTKEQRWIYERAFLSGYGAVDYVNQKASPADTVYTLNGGFLHYYLKPRVIDYYSVAAARITPVFGWPEDRRWIEWLERQSVDWIILRLEGGEWGKLPERDLVKDSYWPQFSLVYADSEAWVFRRVPSPRAEHR